MNTPQRNQDNRAYNYTNPENTFRPEYPFILKLVEPNSTVVDLGCGDGSLLKLLADKKRCKGVGFEIAESGVEKAQNKGLEVYQRSIDQYHPDIAQNQYDYAICNVTIQMVMYPEILMEEMGRIAKRQIISFPNFATFRNRKDLLIHGRMPHPMLFGYKWYSTGHIHQLSITDFEEFCRQYEFSIMERMPTDRPKSRIMRILVRKFPEIFASTMIYLLGSRK